MDNYFKSYKSDKIDYIIPEVSAITDSLNEAMSFVKVTNDFDIKSYKVTGDFNPIVKRVSEPIDLQTVVISGNSYYVVTEGYYLVNEGKLKLKVKTKYGR